ncbi:hypothetical protein AGOR_G00049660 [Albula goreensis]|uniref:Arrestin C-terminal-like domain-containing protein n=1 Tax=Albula goreensis TaxID=1534307 RepID=A0A8T3DVM3_9TELE|nr:hypothetical protein AGOR_G00049660 [Albula goreensis]
MFEETFKSFTINYDALNERNTFSCGNVVSGRIYFEISKDVKVNSITFAVKGKAKVAWSTGSSKNRRHYSAREEYFNIKGNIVEQRNNAVGADYTVLTKGAHVYPFAVQLPYGNFPTSFQGLHGRVAYTLDVQIHRPWHLAKEFRTELNFVSHIDANHPQLLVPLAASNSKTLCCLCCVSGPISLMARLERKGYVPGEMIAISAEFENTSSRTVYPEATLVQMQTFYTSSRLSRKRLDRNITMLEGRPLMPYTTEVWANQMLQIPVTTPLTVSNCQILEVEYSLRVSVRIPGGINLSVALPVVICSVPVNYQSQSS